jgi:hypothetical protein
MLQRTLAISPQEIIGLHSGLRSNSTGAGR